MSPKYFRCLVAFALLVAACGDDSSSARDAAVDGHVGDGGVDASSGPDGSMAATLVQCPGPALTPAAGEACTVTHTAAAPGTVLLRGTVLTSDKVYQNGQVLVSTTTGKIICGGCDCSAGAGFATASVVECADGVISPGLINAHDHLQFDNVPPHGTLTVRYDNRQEWRSTCGGPVHTLGFASNAQMSWAELREVMAGVTSTIAESAVTKLVRNLDVSTKLEGLPPLKDASTTFPLGDGSSPCPRLATGCAYPKVPSVSTIAGDDAYIAHVSEGLNAESHNEFLCQSIEAGGGHDTTGPKTAFVHAVALTAADVAKLRESDTTVVWSPRSNVYLYGNTAQVTMMDHLGVRLALGTDWTTSGSLNLLRELRCADSLNQTYYDHEFTDEQLWRMVTVNGARAVGEAANLGDIRAGMYADIAIYRLNGKAPHRAVIDAEPADVALTMRGGQILTGDADLITGVLGSVAATACDDENVCGTAKKLCVSSETGMALAALRTSSANAAGKPANEPLYYCGTPANEPSCKPSRPGEYTGDPTPDDLDGDGIPNAMDNCPRVFNPIRPMDNGKQPDADNDGIGDVCDPCPQNAGSVCTFVGPDPNDSDGDTIPNATDNCPLVANRDQLDTDHDGTGDVCDACPTVANPGGAPCTLSVHDLRDPALGRSALNKSVHLAGLTVLFVRTIGFYARDAGGRDYAGIFVFTRTAPVVGGMTPVPGMIVSVTGTFTAFNSTDEIDSPVITLDAATGGDVTPVPAATAELEGMSVSGEKLESLLVRMSNVTVKAKLPADDDFYITDTPTTEDCSAVPFPRCARVGDFIIDKDLTNGVPASAVDQTFTTVTGLVDGFGDYDSINPTTVGDLVTP